MDGDGSRAAGRGLGGLLFRRASHSVMVLGCRLCLSVPYLRSSDALCSIESGSSIVIDSGARCVTHTMLDQACWSKVFAYLHADECLRLAGVCRGYSSAVVAWSCEARHGSMPVPNVADGTAYVHSSSEDSYSYMVTENWAVVVCRLLNIPLL